MNPSESMEMAEHLRACFRTMSQQQVDAVANNLEQYEPGPVLEAIRAHVAKFKFVDGKELFEDIANRSSDLSRQRRIEQAETESREKKRKVDEAKGFVKQTHSKNDTAIEFITSLDDATLAAMKEDMIANHTLLKDSGKDFLRSVDARHNAILARIIYDFVDTCGVTEKPHTPAARANAFLGCPTVGGESRL